MYVDKTRWIYEMVRYSKGVYFLTWPRRFGNGSAEEALAQIRKQEYARRYALSTKKVILMGVNFDTKSREVAVWIVE